ncbi:hypothetical protein Goshw_018530 [Gossypium schwendimanii]|uniref:Uncharacterized protein n=1 Tax=Gossypium schwendimanii TaxID=34291 RepID=A0A7J9LP76_GOSSC|nr:hypothetical protein [Gossypium schwendimanii]
MKQLISKALEFLMLKILNHYQEDWTNSAILKRLKLMGAQVWFHLKKVGCPPQISEYSRFSIVKILEPFPSASTTSPPFEN